MRNLQQLGQLRDSLLSSAVVIYILGYLAWNFYAWQNNLGLLPLIEPQYFMAGILPVLILLATCWIMRHGQSSLEKTLGNLYQSTATGRQRFVVAALGVTLGLLGWMLYLRAMARHQDPTRHMTLFDFVLGLLTLYLSSMVCLLIAVPWTYRPPCCTSPERAFARQGRATRLLRLFTTYALPVLIGLCAFCFYLRYVYPSWPQEMGGVKSRYAYLDIKADEVSPRTIKQLLPPGALVPSRGKEEGGEVVWSRKMEVLYRSNDLMMVKPYEEPPAPPAPHTGLLSWSELFPSQHTVIRTIFKIDQPKSTVFEIRVDAVHCVHWCDVNDEAAPEAVPTPTPRENIHPVPGHGPAAASSKAAVTAKT